MGGQTGPSFVFSTDATGNVSGWNISINYSDGTNNTEVAAQNPGTVVTGYGGQYVDGTYFDNVDKVSGPTSSVLDTASTAAGSWYCLAPLVDPLTAQVTVLTAQVTTLQAQVTTLQSQLAAAQAKAAELQSHVASLRAEVTSVIAERNKAEAEAASLRARLAAANAEIAALKAEIKALKK